MVLSDGLSVAEAFLAAEVVLLAGLGLPVLVVLPADEKEEVSSWVLLSVEVVMLAGEVLAA